MQENMQENIAEPNFNELFEESIKNLDMRSGMIVDGRVVGVGPDMVTVDAGLKSEGYIPLSEFKGLSGKVEVKVGDVIEVFINRVADNSGETIMSREDAKKARKWEELEKKRHTGAIIKGTITSKIKGGFTVEIGDDVRAFLPGSLVDVRPVRDPSYLEGKELDFKIIKLDQKRDNVVVSRRAVVESEFSEEREELLATMEEGKVLSGTVKNLTDYGAFIDLGGIDGLLHITDMAWKRIRHPSEVVEMGQEISVKVLKFDKEKNRVSLGLKQMGEDPWANLTRRYPVNTRLFGRVTNIADYGCFVEIEEGVEGLVHVSEMDWTNRNVSPAKVVIPGDEVEVMVLDIDEERRRVSLGMKQCKPNPWQEFAAGQKKGDIVAGQIKSITDFGIFVGLNGGIDGLIHLTDISWDAPGEVAVRKYKKGQEIKTIVLAVDPERERISLGIKQLQQDPFAKYLGEHRRGSVVRGKVTEVDVKSVYVDLGDGVEGHIRAAEVSRERVEDIRAMLNAGDEIEAKFIGVDRKNRVISLSVKEKLADEENLAVKEYATSSTGADGTASLGDIVDLGKEIQNNE